MWTPANKNPGFVSVCIAIMFCREHICEIERAVPSVDDSPRCLE